MRLSQVLRAVAALAVLPLVVGCAGVSYRDRATLSHTRYATVENFGDREITAEQVDGLLEEVADILDVSLEPGKPKVRIVVTTPSRIADLYRRVATVAPHGADAIALYFPGASLIMIDAYDRTILGHELAHYVTDHYLKSAPRKDWERIAHTVEHRLPRQAPAVARTPVAAPVVAARAAERPAPADAPGN